MGAKGVSLVSVLANRPIFTGEVTGLMSVPRGHWFVACSDHGWLSGMQFGRRWRA